MTSKDVDKLIRSELWPFVREPGLWPAAAGLVVGVVGFCLPEEPMAADLERGGRVGRGRLVSPDTRERGGAQVVTTDVGGSDRRIGRTAIVAQRRGRVLLCLTHVVKDNLGRVSAGDHGDDRQAVVGFDAVGHEDAACFAAARHRVEVRLVLGRVAECGGVERARDRLPLLDGQRHREGKIVDRQL